MRKPLPQPLSLSLFAGLPDSRFFFGVAGEQQSEISISIALPCPSATAWGWQLSGVGVGNLKTVQADGFPRAPPLALLNEMLSAFPIYNQRFGWG
jgi:hypothetical protein